MGVLSKLYRSLRKIREDGFTLIELLVVIGLLGIVASVAILLINPQAQIAKANDGLRKSDLAKIQSALEIYRANNGDYPGTVGWCSQLSSAGSPQVRNALEPQYMSEIPEDPSFGGTQTDYFYWHNSFGRYRLYAVLEYTSDPSVVPGILMNDGGGGCSGANASYNFRVTNL